MTDPRGPVEAAGDGVTRTDVAAGADARTGPIDPGTAWSPAPVEGTAPPAAATATTAGNRTRWIVAGLGLVLIAALTIGAGILLSSRSTPEALGYIPADSAIVAEVRMDLPGDQLQKVGNLLAHFPGFKDQSTLPQKLDESFTKLVTAASNGTVDYAKQIKPWIGGPVFMAASAPTAFSEPFPSLLPSTAPLAQVTGVPSAGVIVATTDGTATCESLFPAGQTPTTTTYQGVTIVASGDTEACALNGRIGIIGPTALVKAALDAHAAHNGLDTSSLYRTARETLGGDRLATFYLSKASLTAAMTQGGTGPLPLPTGQLQAALTAFPDWLMYGVSAEDDALVADVVSAPFTAPAPTAGATPLPTAPPAHLSQTAALVPANTLALVDVHGAGIAIKNVLATLKDNPALGQSLGQLDAPLAAVGGPDALVGWIDDAGIAVLPDGTGATGGLLLLAPDATTATAKVAQLKSVLSLAGLSGTQVQVHDETVGGVTMTVVDLGDLGTLLQTVGGGTVPVPAGTHVSLGFAAKGSAVIAGGDVFVRAVLGVGTGGSLADAPGYKHALGRATAQNFGEIYVGPESLLALANTALPEADRASFGANTKPYLEPFDAILMTTTLEHGGVHVRIVATVK
jgi:hypothetical protein